ncbi:flavoprotein [Acetobacterium paludosum]|uniref:Flavoprotein n=2 Tax=Acetobacterium paludosum TaxID=52693 RepID=A0A923HU29_9FIRM|nr:flavoprotein [Acetobacterium paludosum]
MDMKKMLDDGLMDILIQKIVDEVIRRIKNQPKKAVVFFTGGAIGFRQSMDSLLKLQKDGWQLKVVLSDDGMKVLNPDAIQKELNLDKIYYSGNIKSQKELYSSAEVLIIGTMSINTAAKIATGVTDSVFLTIINHGIMAGIPVIAAKNACDPDDPQRAELGMGKSPQKYRQMLINNMDTLSDFGMQLVNGEDLYTTCVSGTPTVKKKLIVAGTAVPENIEPAVRPAVTAKSGECVLDKKVISRSDILKIRDAEVVKIPAGSIVTEYAVEAINTFGLQIIRI